ncbi:TolA protein [Pseudomonas chlororaphis subsp. piscium]|nr:TolA protein [Pseudomonas chlororaphis subsp. piscium]
MRQLFLGQPRFFAPLAKHLPESQANIHVSSPISKTGSLSVMAVDSSSQYTVNINSKNAAFEVANEALHRNVHRNTKYAVGQYGWHFCHGAWLRLEYSAGAWHWCPGGVCDAAGGVNLVLSRGALDLAAPACPSHSPFVKGAQMKYPLIFALLSASCVAQADYDNGASSYFNTRLLNVVETTDWNFSKAVDPTQIFNDWRTNQPRAEIKYSQPRLYHGRIDKIVADNGNANFILNFGKKTAVTVTLAPVQAASWSVVGNHLKAGELQPNREFAANIDAGRDMFFHCVRVEFGIGVYLVNCIAIPPNIALGKARPEVIYGMDSAVSFEDLIKARASEGWARPPSARRGMATTLHIGMEADGTITSTKITKSSGDDPYDQSVVAAIQNIGRLNEVQDMRSSDISAHRSFSMTFTPDDLAL